MVIEVRTESEEMNPRAELVIALGGKCATCGIDDSEMLHLDHICDDGTTDLKRFGSNAAMYLYYFKHQDEAKTKLQVLCANHNWKKRYSKEKRPAPPRAISLPPIDPSYYFDRDLTEDYMIVWKDHARLPPTIIRHFGPKQDGKYCDSIAGFELLGDQESRRFFLRCSSCGWDMRILIEKEGGSDIFIGRGIRKTDGVI